MIKKLLGAVILSSIVSFSAMAQDTNQSVMPTMPNPMDPSTWMNFGAQPGQAGQPGQAMTLNPVAPEFWGAFVNPGSHQGTERALMNPMNWGQFMTPQFYMQMMNPAVWTAWMNPQSYAPFMDPNAWMYWMNPASYMHMMDPSLYMQMANPGAYMSMMGPAMQWMNPAAYQMTPEQQAETTELMNKWFKFLEQEQAAGGTEAAPAAEAETTTAQ